MPVRKFQVTTITLDAYHRALIRKLKQKMHINTTAELVRVLLRKQAIMIGVEQ